MEINKEPKRPKTVANTNSKAIKSVINTNPQLPGVVENGPVVAKSPLAEKILALTSRRKRDAEMREEQSEIRILEPVIEQAPAERMKLRAESMARNILRQRFSNDDYYNLNESNRTHIDSMVESRPELIQSVAKRLMPKIRESELQRMNKPLIERHTFESLIDAMLTENLDAKIEKLIRLGLGDKNQLNKVRQALSNTTAAANTVVLRKYIVDTLDKLMKLVTDDAVVYQRIVATLMKKRNLKESAVSVALRRKSEKTGYDFETLAEVFIRGVQSWDESASADPTQHAFNRVNSFVSGGKAMRLDEDLVHTSRADQKSRIIRKNGHAVTSKHSRGEIEINEVKPVNKSAVDTKPTIPNKSVRRNFNTIQLKSKDPLSSDYMNEKFETAEKQSKNPADPSSRFDGTDSVTGIYKKDTPGQKGLAKKFKKIAETTTAGFNGKKINIKNVPVRLANGKIKSLPPGKSSSSDGGDGE
jgi:hypothetical protein